MVSDEGLTSLQLRERDYQTYLDLFVNNTKDKSTISSQAGGGSSSGKPFYPDASLWRRFTEGSNTLTLEEYDALAQGMVDSIPTTYGGSTSTSSPSHTISNTTAANSLSSSSGKIKQQKKAGEGEVVDVITIDVSIPKQQQFFACLSDFDTLMKEAGVSYFLCCGTALGMIRESRFIPHDNDIDVGIMFSEGTTSSTPKPCEITQEGILILLGHLHTSTFVCIDCIGEVDKGLEIRLQHQDTGVLLDINLYYSSHHSSSEEESSSSSPFVWCATHYAESASRRHGMYRYKHTPFLNELTTISIGASSDNNGSKKTSTTISAYLPPTSYLEEYFGSDWTVPKKYSYEEGLKGEYKNIIQE